MTRNFGHQCEGTGPRPSMKVALAEHERWCRRSLRGGVGVLVVGRSSIGHPDLSLTCPRLRLKAVNVQGREGGRNLEGGGGMAEKESETG